MIPTIKQKIYNSLNRLEAVTDLLVKYMEQIFITTLFGGLHFFGNINAKQGSSLTFYFTAMGLVTTSIYLKPRVEKRYKDLKNRAFTTQRVIEEL